MVHDAQASRVGIADHRCDAIAAFRYGIDVAPDEAAFYFNLAGLYASREDRPAARAVIEALLRRKPGDPKARQALRELE